MGEASSSPSGSLRTPRDSKRGRGHRAIFFGYVALGCILAFVALRRGMVELESWLVGHSRYAFRAAELHLDRPPSWADDRILLAARRAAAPLEGRSVLERSFDRDLRTALGRVPWISAVQETRFESRRVDVRVRYRVPIAWVPVVGLPAGSTARSADPASESALGVYLASDGSLLPYGGRPLRLPGLRSRRGELTMRELRVAAREITDLSRVLRRGVSSAPNARPVEGARLMWRSWLGVEVVREARADGRSNVLFDLLFRAEGTSCCRIHWGRGQLDTRPGDLAFARKVSHLARIHYHHPGWRDVSRGLVSFDEPVIYRRVEEARSLDGAFAAADGQ